PTVCYSLSLHDALPICAGAGNGDPDGRSVCCENRQTDFGLRGNWRFGDHFSGQLLRGSISLAESSDWFLEFLHRRPVIDLLQTRSEEHTSELQSLRHLV